MAFTIGRIGCMEIALIKVRGKNPYTIVDMQY
jgi:hypothetical protein